MLCLYSEGMSDNEFQVNDKVICIDDSDDYAAFGKLPNHLEIGKIYVVHKVSEYNIRGPVLQVEPNTNRGYEARHFRLISRQ